MENQVKFIDFTQYRQSKPELVAPFPELKYIPRGLNEYDYWKQILDAQRHEEFFRPALNLMKALKWNLYDFGEAIKAPNQSCLEVICEVIEEMVIN